MNILFLSGNEISVPLYTWLCTMEERVTMHHDKIDAAAVQTNHIDFIISYNYRHFIRPDVLECLPGRIINLHISLLPWNRGASPNLWSFIEGTPCGVTIHQIDEGLDTGDILVQQAASFDYEKDTLRSSYDALHCQIQRLFKKHWRDICGQNIPPKKQPSGGSFHRMADLDPYAKFLDYDDTIQIFLEKVKSVPK